MSNYKIIHYVVCLIFVFSCNSNNAKHEKISSQPKTPVALQESHSENKLYSRSEDLVEQLFQELLENNTALKKLERDINLVESNVTVVSEKYHQFDSKSKNYYSSANTKLTSISDSLLREKIQDIIKASHSQYKSKTVELDALYNQVIKHTYKLNDYYTVMKILLTLPQIEEYQVNNQPEKKQFKAVLEDQQKIIVRTDSLTPKY